jgi:hypothetical protein
MSWNRREGRHVGSTFVLTLRLARVSDGWWGFPN